MVSLVVCTYFSVLGIIACHMCIVQDLLQAYTLFLLRVFRLKACFIDNVGHYELIWLYFGLMWFIVFPNIYHNSSLYLVDKRLRISIILSLTIVDMLHIGCLIQSVLSKSSSIVYRRSIFVHILWTIFSRLMFHMSGLYVCTNFSIFSCYYYYVRYIV